MSRRHARDLDKQLRNLQRAAGSRPSRDQRLDIENLESLATAAWAEANSLSQAAQHPYWDRHGQRQNEEAEGHSMVTAVLRIYADKRGLAYDGPPGPRQQAPDLSRGRASGETFWESALAAARGEE